MIRGFKQRFKMFKDFKKGLITENPIFCLMLGLCPALAVSTSVVNGLGMGAAFSFVLLCSNLIIAALRKLIPDKIRIPCFIVIIATFVTLVEMFMKAFTPALNKSLGIYVPLIVVNCIILGRAEAFASKHPVLRSGADALGMGVGFTGALVIVSVIRELFGAGTILGYRISNSFEPVSLMILAPGAFLTLGLLLGFFNLLKERKKWKK